MTDDSKRICDRADKTPDHECREALLNATIKDVVHVCSPGDVSVQPGAREDRSIVQPPRDSLYLVLQDGSAVEIEAERLYFDLVPDYGGELAAIRIEAQEAGLRPPTPRPTGTNHHGYPGSGKAWA